MTTRLAGSLTVLTAAVDADLEPLLRRALVQMRLASKRAISEREAERQAVEAIERTRRRYPEFDRCVRFILVLLLRWLPNWKLTDLDQTLEMCMLVLRHASFTADMRAAAYNAAEPAGGIQ